MISWFFSLFLCSLLAQNQPISNSGFEILSPSGFPADWDPVGTEVAVSNDTHSGGKAMRFSRTPDSPAETGINRSWVPESGQQGQMLQEIEGGVTFWYKALSGRGDLLRFCVIAMGESAIEDTGEDRATFKVPQDHVGDGQWHEGRLKFNFSSNPKVRWVQISPRLVGDPGEWLLDDVTYVSSIGSSLHGVLALAEDVNLPGLSCSLSCKITNVGDSTSSPGQVTLSLPQGLQSQDPFEQPVEEIGPDQEKSFQWTVTGERTVQGEIGVTIRCGETVTQARVPLTSNMGLKSFLASPFILAPGQETTLEAHVSNDGSAFLTDLGANLSLPEGSEILETHVPSRIHPGGRGRLTWRIRPSGTGEQLISLSLNTPGAPSEPSVARLFITDAVQAESKTLGGFLRTRSGSKDILGEVVVGIGDREKVWARLPHLGKVTYRRSDGQLSVVPCGGDVQYTLEHLTARVQDPDSGTWTFEVLAKETETPYATRLTFSVSCDQDRDLVCYEGPMIYVGEGMRNFVRADAVFPGLEWLEKDEFSSSDLDIRSTHPDRIRYVPHPNKVTIPLMSVRADWGTCLALLWDVHQKWDGVRDRPQPVFASPDQFSGRASHLMGLMAPNVPAGLKENDPLGGQALRLSASSPVKLEAVLVALPEAPDALASMDLWFQFFEPDPILPTPEGNYERQIAFSMKAYTDTLWVSPEQGWLPFLGGPSIWRHPGPHMDYCFDLLAASRMVSDPGLCSAWRSLANSQELQSKSQASADDLGFSAGHLEATLERLGFQAYAFKDAMEEDGSWRFDADLKDQGVFRGMDYHLLGTDDAVELGTCARKAYEILRFARLSGDPVALQAGETSLRLMASFSVPRAAQVWEVPVHSPDILAAADAMDACLEAYQITRSEEWLEQARIWARAGLPFIYLWSEEGKPWMRYGSIPVFGASWMDCSWFGNIVQWNGLRYAYALLKLNKIDQDTRFGRLTWEDLARGITHSAMYQQSKEDKTLALWPDSLHTITSVRANWEFPPRLILKNITTLLGREEEPETVTLQQGDAHIPLTTNAEILEAHWRSNSISAVFRFPPGESGHALAAGLEKPTKVTLNGQDIPEMDAIEESQLPAWRYTQESALLVIKIPSDGEWKLRFEGVRSRPVSWIPEQVTGIAFEFDGGLDGWTAANDLSKMISESGTLKTTATGGDPYLVRQRCKIPSQDVNTVEVRMRASIGSHGQFYWDTEASPGFDEAKCLQFELAPNGEWLTVVLDVGSHPLWQGNTIQRIRLDPSNGAAGADVEVDWIRGTK